MVITILFPLCRCGPRRATPSTFTRFLDHTQRRNTLGRTPLDEWSARRRDLYLTTHNTHNRQTSITQGGLEPAISASETYSAGPGDRQRPKGVEEVHVCPLLNLGTRWCGWSKPRLGRFTSREWYPVRIVQVVGWASSVGLEGYEKSSLRRDSIPRPSKPAVIH